MAVSYWGVDHGDEVSKSRTNREKARGHILGSSALGAIPYGSVASGGYGALTAKKGRRGGAAATAGGSTLGGRFVGRAVGSLATRGSVGGSLVGQGAGGVLGSYLGAVNNVQRGRVAGIRRTKYPMDKG